MSEHASSQTEHSWFPVRNLPGKNSRPIGLRLHAHALAEICRSISELRLDIVDSKSKQFLEGDLTTGHHAAKMLPEVFVFHTLLPNHKAAILGVTQKARIAFMKNVPPWPGGCERKFRSEQNSAVTGPSLL